MDTMRIKLSALWAALMFTYLLGDVVRVFSGDFIAGQIGGEPVAQGMYVGMAALMVIPALMVFLVLVLKRPINRWVNIALAIFFFGFNLVGLPMYPALYDKFLISVGLVLNVLIAWYAWTWARVIRPQPVK